MITQGWRALNGEQRVLLAEQFPYYEAPRLRCENYGQGALCTMVHDHGGTHHIQHNTYNGEWLPQFEWFSVEGDDDDEDEDGDDDDD